MEVKKKSSKKNVMTPEGEKVLEIGIKCITVVHE